MRYLKSIINAILLFTVPSVMAYPQHEIVTSAQPITNEVDIAKRQVLAEQMFSYDDVLDLLEELEEGELEKRCGPKELEKLNQFLVLLARQGILPNDVDEELILENDIQELLYPDPNPYEYGAASVIYHSQADIILCKSWLKKKCSQAKRFAQKHRKILLIGAAVIVAAAAVVCVVAASSAAAASAVAAAGAQSSSGHEGKTKSVPEETSHVAIPKEPVQLEMPIILANQESSNLKAAMDEHISTFKEMLSVDEALKTDKHQLVGEKVRDLGAFLAHEILSGISQLALCVPKLAEEIKDIGSALLPIDLGLQPNSQLIHGSPVENYKNLEALGHQKIDQIFSTDFGGLYTSEIKENKLNKFAIGMLPFPGLLGTSSVETVTGRLAATEVSSVRGWSVGQPTNNRTAFGTIPKWSTVRSRYWKNRAQMHTNKYEPHELERMKRGLAPQRFNPNTGQWESKELHHNPAQKDGGLFDVVEVWADEHATIDRHRYTGQ